MEREQCERIQALRWSTPGHCWYGGTDTISLLISEKAYERHLKEYMATHNREWKTLAEIRQKAEQEWMQQCKAIDEFRADLASWLGRPGVEIRYPAEGEQHTTQEGYALRWVAASNAWSGKTNEGLLLLIADELYEKHLQAYLAAQGITPMFWTRIMEPAEQEWREQCEIEQACRGDITYWLSSDGPGVQCNCRKQRSKTRQFP